MSPAIGPGCSDTTCSVKAPFTEATLQVTLAGNVFDGSPSTPGGPVVLHRRDSAIDGGPFRNLIGSVSDRFNVRFQAEYAP
jgi:hypothetical protein